MFQTCLLCDWCKTRLGTRQRFTSLSEQETRSGLVLIKHLTHTQFMTLHQVLDKKVLFCVNGD